MTREASSFESEGGVACMESSEPTLNLPDYEIKFKD